MDERADDVRVYPTDANLAYIPPDAPAYGPGVEPGDLKSDVPAGERPLDEGTPETGRIRENIEQTRAEMSGTLDAIQEKLSPQRLAAQARETVQEATVGRAGQMVSNATESARGAGTTIWQTIRENPLPAALAGAGLGWLFWKMRETGQQRPPSGGVRYAPSGPYAARRVPIEAGATYRPGYTGTDTGYYSGSSYGGTSYGESGGPSATERAQQKAGQLAGQARETAGDLGERAQETAGQLGETAQWQATRARSWFERTLQENPLALGAMALAAGTVVGLSVPETQPEHQVFGEARDTVVERAQQVAQQTVERVKSVAQEATSAATHEAQQQGLTQ